MLRRDTQRAAQRWRAQWSLAVGALIGCLTGGPAWSDAPPPYRPKGDAVRQVALIKACEAGEVEAVRSLLKRGADPTWVAPEGYVYPHASGPAALLAVERGQVAIVALLLDQRPGLSQTHGCTLLDQALAGLAAATDQAAQGRYLRILKLLVSHKVDVNRPDLGGYTPLMAAARARHPEAVRMLLDAGASPRAKNSKGETALMLARGGASPAASPEQTAIITLLEQAEQR